MSKEKTMHELAKEFPDKTYRELEKYRDSDRQEEAQQIPLTESQQSQEDLEPIEKGACVIGEARKDREQAVNLMMGECKRLVKERDKEHKLRQEAEVALANALAVNESHQKLNGKLQERLTEVEEENKKMHDHLNKQVQSARKAGI